MSRVLFLSRVLLLEAQQEQTSKLSIFLIKLSHSSSTYENTFAFQHFSDRRRAITFGLKERAILFAYSVRTVLGSSRSSSVTITELLRSILLLDYRSVHRPFNYRSISVHRPFFLNGRPLYGSNGGLFFDAYRNFMIQIIKRLQSYSLNRTDQHSFRITPLMLCICSIKSIANSM